MSRTYFIILCILLTVAGFVPPANSQVKRNEPDPCPDHKAYIGKYRNLVYGFSIVIPAGFKGYWNSAPCAPDEKYGCLCLGDHGRFIPLSDDAHIEAFVSYQMESEWSVIDHENNDISSLRNEKGIEQVMVIGSRWFRLGNLKGRRFMVRFVENTKNVVTDHIIALHRGVEYELILHTSTERYQGDEIQFEKVVASWRLTPRM